MASAFFFAEAKFQNQTSRMIVAIFPEETDKPFGLVVGSTVFKLGNSALQPADRTKQFVYGWALPRRFWQPFQFAQSLPAFTQLQP
jgi:hypothetical protein